MSENNPQTLTEPQKNKLLLEVHRSLVGDPLDPRKPGLVAIVGRHHQALYGDKEEGGLVADSVKYKRLFWVGTGVFLAGQCLIGGFFTWWISSKAGH
jgi:hypothetical protein